MPRKRIPAGIRDTDRPAKRRERPCDLCKSEDYTIMLYGVCNACVAGLIAKERDKLADVSVLERRKPH